MTNTNDQRYKCRRCGMIVNSPDELRINLCVAATRGPAIEPHDWRPLEPSQEAVEATSRGWMSGMPYSPIERPDKKEAQKLNQREAQMKTELQLLVIDLGETCCVTVEEGRWSPDFMLTDVQEAGESRIVTFTFSGLKAAIDALEGEKPIPRVEVDGTPNLRIYRHSEDEEPHWIDMDCFNALCELAGKPLPVWEQGTWTLLNEPVEGVPAIWRYRKS